MINAKTLGVFGLLVLLGAGCNELVPLDDGGGGGGNATPAAVQEILNNRCAIPGCHSGTQPPDLRAGTVLVGAPSTASIPLVEKFNVQNSYLAHVIVPDLEGRIASAPVMPPGGGMPPEEIALILGWIAGAPFPMEGTGGGMTTGTGGGMDTTAGDTAGEPTGGGGEYFVPAEVQQVFTDSCAFTGCHAAGFQPPDLTDVSALIGVTAMQVDAPYIDPGALENSYIAIKMADIPGATVERQMALMPIGTPVPPEDLELVFDWIENGPFTEGGASTGAGGTTDGGTTGAATSGTGSGSDSGI